MTFASVTKEQGFVHSGTGPRGKDTGQHPLQQTGPCSKAGRRGTRPHDPHLTGARQAPWTLPDPPKCGPQVQRKCVIFNKRTLNSIKATLTFPYLVY